MIAPARQLSYRILLQIATTDAHSDDLLHAPAVDALSPADRHLTTTLVLGTLRWQLALDARIRKLLARPETKLSPEAATALRLGAFQLLHLDRVPAHAVLNDSVELVKQSKERRAAGMVNAVLRKIQGSERRAQSLGMARHRERAARRRNRRAMVAPCVDGQALGALLRQRIRRGHLPLGQSRPRSPSAYAIRTCHSMASRPSLVRSWRTRGILSAATLAPISATAASVCRTKPRSWSGRSPPLLFPRLRASSMPAPLPVAKPRILAERLPNAQITAVDISHKRLETMRRLLPASLVAKLRFEVADAAALELQPEYDLILCDVPCSGTGTMARNPEIKLRLTEPDLARQHARQVAILGAGLKGLKPGGRLVYSTCSLEPEENEAVISEVLATARGFRLVSIDSLVERLVANGVLNSGGRSCLESAIQGGFLRTVPGVHPCDGFFAAVLAQD